MPVIDAHHNGLFQGHWGPDRTADSISRRYTFPNMKAAVKRYVTACHECQTNKATRRPPQGLTVALHIPEKPWHSISIDWIHGLPVVHPDEHTSLNAVLTVTDRFSKMVHLIPTNKRETSEDTIRLLMWNVFKYHGFPSSIHSDNDTN